MNDTAFPGSSMSGLLDIFLFQLDLIRDRLKLADLSLAGLSRYFGLVQIV